MMKPQNEALQNQNPTKIAIPPGYMLANQAYLEGLEQLIQNLPPFSLLWGHLDASQQQQLAGHLPFSTSQLAQDLFVISESCKRAIPPFFVEVGATDGISLSNTYILETRLQGTSKNEALTGIKRHPKRRHRDGMYCIKSPLIEQIGKKVVGSSFSATRHQPSRRTVGDIGGS